MSNEKLPIKFFAPREVDELRVEPGGNSDPPKWLLADEELEQRSIQLSADFDEFEALIVEKEAKSSPIPFIFIARMCDDSTAKSRRKDIANLFQVTDRSNIIGLSEADKLIVRLDSIAEMKTVSSCLKDYERNNYAISCLESFTQYEPIFIEGEKATVTK